MSIPPYSQVNRPIQVTTPLGRDVLLAVGFAGREGISQLFHFTVDVLAEKNREIAFDMLLGEKVTIHLQMPGGRNYRYFSGICQRVTQGARDRHFCAYQLEVVPQFWLLTKRAQSRIFQHQGVDAILKKVLEGLDVEFQLPRFETRNYCVQYRETDFAFASRLMEEEGVFYFFKHTANGHTMVVANSPQSHPDMPERSTVIFEEVLGGRRDEDRVVEWRKAQELRSQR